MTAKNRFPSATVFLSSRQKTVLTTKAISATWLHRLHGAAEFRGGADLAAIAIASLTRSGSNFRCQPGTYDGEEFGAGQQSDAAAEVGSQQFAVAWAVSM